MLDFHCIETMRRTIGSLLLQALPRLLLQKMIQSKACLHRLEHSQPMLISFSNDSVFIIIIIFKYYKYLNIIIIIKTLSFEKLISIG